MKYLYFETDGDGSSGVCIPASSVVGLEVHTANTTLEIFFNDLGAANANDGSVVLAVTAGKTKEAAEDIAKAIYQGAETFVTIADDQNSEYASSHIANCGTITLA
tara:strand:+ start:28 stop:342 length:315 start_codon:yes stop_codon:yes gene_type:complete